MRRCLLTARVAGFALAQACAPWPGSPDPGAVVPGDGDGADSAGADESAPPGDAAGVDCQDDATSVDPLRLGRNDTLEIATWNLHNFPATTATVTATAALVTRMQVDVVAIQEVADVQGFASLVTALPAYRGVLSPDVYTPTSYQKTAFLWRAETLTLVGTASLFQSDSDAFPRPPLQGTFDVRRCDGGTRRIVVINVHLKASPGADNEARRRSAIVKLKTYVDSLVAEGSTEVVIAGDFNDRVGDAAATNVFTALLDDPAHYTVTTTTLDDGLEYTYIPFASFLDHLVVTAALGGFATQVVHLDLLVTDYRYVDVVSDHRSVVSVWPR
ncbi:MAG: endonuclease/exonuclease/phosphatase family protein [Deltaproteobacteria bacterium]|nr:endonuclease/exonuclease/phosphatase family protein [Deltaproteobacteria bacterium]